MPNRRTVFFVSDRTGITAEMLGNSLLSQFEEIEFQRLTIPFVDSAEKIAAVIDQINETRRARARPPIVFSSIVDEAMSETMRRDANALTLDLFQIFIAPLETELGAKSSHAAGRSHGIANSHEYFARMDAINFAQAHDDGAATRDLAQGAGHPGRRVALRQDADVALPRAAVRHPRGEFPADARRFRRPRAAGVGAAAQGPAVRPHDQSGAAAQDPRGAPPGQQVRGARQLPLRGARVRAPDASAKASRCSTRRRSRSRRSRRRSATAPSCAGTSTDAGRRDARRQVDRHGSRWRRSCAPIRDHDRRLRLDQPRPRRARRAACRARARRSPARRSPCCRAARAPIRRSPRAAPAPTSPWPAPSGPIRSPPTALAGLDRRRRRRRLGAAGRRRRPASR